MFRIAAYGWEKGFSKQVVYRAADGHIHELFFFAGGVEPGFWDHADVTQITGAPLPASLGAFSGYEWEPLASKQAVYTTEDGHIHELFVQVGGLWSHADLTQIAGAPPTFDSFSFAGYQWRTAGTKQVVYVGADSHVHELFVPVGGSWSHADLTALTGGTPLFVDQVSFAGYEWDLGGSKQVPWFLESLPTDAEGKCTAWPRAARHCSISSPYQRPRRRGNRPAYGHGLLRAASLALRQIFSSQAATSKLAFGTVANIFGPLRTSQCDQFSSEDWDQWL